MSELNLEPLAFIFSKDIKKLETTECEVGAYSVSMGSPDDRTVPVYSQAHIDSLKQQLEQAQARIGELKSSLEDMVYVFETNLNNLDSGDEFEDYQTAKSVLNKTPAQNLAEIETRAVEKFIANTVGWGSSFDNDVELFQKIAKSYMEDLRQQAGR